MSVHDNFVKVVEFLSANGADEEMIEFINSRIAQDENAKAKAKAKRLEKNGGEKKDPADSPFYTEVRDAIYKVLTTTPIVAEELIKKANIVSPSGKQILAAQVGMALKPLVKDGTVVVEDVKYTITGKNGLNREVIRKGYRLA